ncbi:MAG: TetR/AcrR family transcriptional regulator [Haloechinothrix sp.]
MARPKTPILSRAGICAAALEIVDSDGLAALSMRKLAAKLGVQVASLYGHVKTKDDLLHEIGNEIMDQVDVSGFEGGWREGVGNWARSYRAALRAHPNLVPFLAYGPARREAALRRADAVHGGLVGAGWPPRHATLIGASTKYLVVGAAMTSFAKGFDDDVQVYVDRYPHLVQAHRLRENAEQVDQDAFELALKAFLDGLESLYTDVGQRK